MIKVAKITADKVDKISKKIPDNKLREMFVRCFYNTIETTVIQNENDDTFIITGDINAMWLRDSSEQVKHYLPFAKEDKNLKKLIEGVIRRQFKCINIDPYANAFNETDNNKRMWQDMTELKPMVWERKYEIDSLCYPIELSYKYWKLTGETKFIDENMRMSLYKIIELWKKEQRHFEESDYRFERVTDLETETLQNNRRGMPVNYTGMTWSGFRPSDDACTFNYLIPSNMFAETCLSYIEEFAQNIFKDEVMRQLAHNLKKEIDFGIRNYGIYNHPKYGRIYAYETDGFGNYNLMDDANIPGLLSIPYLEYINIDWDVYENTRKFILSRDNPYYFDGKFAKGIGSPHTPKNYIWPMGLIMQALTSKNKEEINEILDMIKKTDAGTNYIHESFDKDNPSNYTRSWFAFANSLFSKLMYNLAANDFFY